MTDTLETIGINLTTDEMHKLAEYGLKMAIQHELNNIINTSTKLDYAELYLFKSKIASILDYPSIYMSGPSKFNLDRGENIYNILSKDFFIIPKPSLDEKSNRIKSWMNPDGSKKDNT